jgi:diketogulonate reductase-like aldo/keto reductase
LFALAIEVFGSSLCLDRIEMGSFFSTQSQVCDPKMPGMIYGTAWKENDTALLTYEALRSGFRGVDTAPQRENYREELVGEGIRKVISEGLIKRSDLYVCTRLGSCLEQNFDQVYVRFRPSSRPHALLRRLVVSHLVNCQL